ncbi:MAG: ATP-binding protein [Caldimonas sp.]
MRAGAAVRIEVVEPAPAAWRSSDTRFARLVLPVLTALLALVAAAFALWAEAHSPNAPKVEFRTAERTLPDGTESTAPLPDFYPFPTRAATPQQVRYRMVADLGAEKPHAQALYFPGLRAPARISVNGHVIEDELRHAEQPAPRSVNAIRLIRIPDEFVAAGPNRVEVVAAGQESVNVSRIWIGPTTMLSPLHIRKIMLGVIGPLLVAMTVGCLALFVLVLWLRRRSEPIYGYFGIAALCWAAHTAWTVWPTAVLHGMHRSIWWTTLYTFFVAMLVIFCVRFAGWRWPRFDRSLWLLSAFAPVALYAASAGGIGDNFFIAWRFGLVLLASVGLAAVARYAWRKRNIDSVMLTAAGLASVAFGLRDWLTDFGDDNNPAFLTPYAGLMFLLLVGWILIDRFVLATRELELLNTELESRVARKSEELVAAMEQMRQARDLAEAANRAKSTFLAAASHDLRQPIHALGLYLAAFEIEDLTTKQQLLARRMSASVAAMESMFGTLLDISRMDAGAVTTHAEPFEPVPLLNRLIEEFAPHARDRRLRLRLHVGRHPPQWRALADSVLLERILRNLIGNAIKYTQRGGVLVSLRLRGGATKGWRLEVWDSGIGIAAHEQERVFEEFYQIGNPERDRANGLGLGLAIVRRLAGLMQVELTLSSVSGRGTRFALDVQATTTPLHDPVETRRPGSIAGMVVAVLEDDLEVRHSMRTLLAHWGCVTCDGAESDEIVARVRAIGISAPQAIIADYRLRRERTGVDEIAHLQRVWGAQIPALLVSGDSAPHAIAALHASGHDWLSKPVPAARLRSWLQSVAAMSDRAELGSLAT